MIRGIIGFSARHPVPVVLAVAALCLAAVWVLDDLRLDALPDLADPQVIVYSRWDRSPDIVEDQLTYPLTRALLGMPRVRAVRGLSDFGSSFIYVVFEDGTDVDWARARVGERLARLRDRLPEGVRVELGPDASSVGWVFQYALVDRSGSLPPDRLRALQDWTLRDALQAVPGVAEVASIGGAVKQYQVTLDPARLAAYGIPLERVVERVRASNDEVGGRLLEFAGQEFMVRGRGYATSVDDFASIVVKTADGGVPVLLRDVAHVGTGPELRRGVCDLDGAGDHVGGIVVMRQGENALNVVRRVRTRLDELAASLPPGVEVVTTYDRSLLIERAIGTLRHELFVLIAIVCLVILLFLWHVPSAIVPIVTIPASALLAFLPLLGLGVTVNIMSLAGIAISIGVLVDGAIVEVENAYNRVHRWLATGRPGSFFDVRLAALQEVGPSVFVSLLVIAVAFLPVFALTGQEGRLFRPLAISKTLVMALAAVLVLTLDPALRMLFARVDPFRFRPRVLAAVANRLLVGTYRSEASHPLSRAVARVYEPACRSVLRRPRLVIAAALGLVALSVPVYFALGTELMPPLNEGSILYMPTTLPGISATEAERLLRAQDRVLRAFPEVERVFGKAGRAETATDPAPLSMIETTILLKPERAWRSRARWYSSWCPGFLAGLLRPFWPDRISWDELVDEMDRALATPGVTNAWTMPIKARTDMLSTGVRTPLGIKVMGQDLAELERTGRAIEAALRGIRGTRSVFAERVGGGAYVDVVPRRDQLARFGLTVDDVQRVVLYAIGGENITTTVEGRERYPVNVRYPRELRDDLPALRRLPVTTMDGTQRVPLAQVAEVRLAGGPAMIRNEDAFRCVYVFVDVAGRDIGGYVGEARRVVARDVALPAGVVLGWSGQYENMLRVRERLRVLVPLTLGLIFLLLLLGTRSTFKTLVVMLAVPFSAIGAVWLFWLLDYNVSVAAWVGMIALLGLDAETGVFMLLFLDLAWGEARAAGRLRTVAEVDEALVAGAVRRVRPKLMTVAASFLGLLPILWSTSAGADVMKRIAAPMIGGLVTSFLLELLVYPAIYKLWKLRTEPPDGGSGWLARAADAPHRGESEPFHAGSHEALGGGLLP
jgi:Cu(I)/Ag(I) efflux system membrane protein CusA/SilA